MGQANPANRWYNGGRQQRTHHAERRVGGGHGWRAFARPAKRLNLPTPTLTVDTSGIILAWSRDAEALLGYSASEALGRSIELIMPEHLRGRHRAGFNRFVQTGISTLPEVVTTPMVHKRGETIKLLISVKAIRDARQQIVAVEATIGPRDSE